MTNSLPIDRRTLVALSILGAVLLASIWATGTVMTDNSPSSPSVDANVSERYRSIDALNATRTVVLQRNGTVTTQTVADVTLVPGTDHKRVRFQNDTSRRYELQVSNGSTLWLHDRDQRVVTAIELTGPPTGSAMSGRLQRLVTAAGLTDGSGRPQPPDVAPLPVVPRHTARSPADDEAGGYTVEYVETASVGGRDAYVLSVRPTTNQTDTHYRQRLWLDTERFYPLRKQTAWTVDGTQRSVTTTYTDVTFDPQVSADTFRPEIGSETTVQRPETPETEWYRSVDRLAAQTSITVPNPSIPSEFELTYATQTTGRVQSVGLRYATEGRLLTISKYNMTYAIDSEERDLTVDGRPATLDYGPTTSLSWTCDQYRYTVRGTGVSTEQLVEVGRSVGCSAS
ncbi:outer membrane lipoprotein carrier protein LolA (plasmid) [Haloferax mediterranei ATCC 33500]|uniref:Outer membrane lipoprotein carrier protein LolA n=1 Tax=Haloferax mediterranei (strain ATCC 33500 / DSM 1411 / JCM 8866 / NBRC 14739 / NCIMB 2177 / R-4) TaxID=523841 RepID=I3RAT6_HALMT|nr:outer membrane lipoprotein carrier protein LolA [Haloferax mediterranei]AFK21346.1 hypothetical protein HFX_6223 [Haloferax mediterranei ATCC 33500]AHZ24570.1 hypothetical protein BM92_16845 [Haloferax mediterranei ATCC 33500]ELZ97327.1 hypothetical protein C439_18433 [Haloferax mediterranei ATCC 33500]MDX5990376.1 outer membrane lipoprotein carrier protein LolA [Haloferax mediterranei ATCC 33500]QCQ76964.1 outer membrane lipoprotein carrier protein LolA [Haloferax mediterranei ATCC 33500]